MQQECPECPLLTFHWRLSSGVAYEREQGSLPEHRGCRVPLPACSWGPQDDTGQLIPLGESLGPMLKPQPPAWPLAPVQWAQHGAHSC